MVIKLKMKSDLVSQQVRPVVMVPQNDGDGRELEMELYTGEEPWAVPAGAAVRLYYAKPNGVGGSYDTLPDGTLAWQAEGNVLTFKLLPQMFTLAGNVAAKVEFVLNDQILYTFGFWIVSVQDCTDEAVPEEAYFNWSAWTQAELERMLTEILASDDFVGPQGEAGRDGIDGVDGEDGYTPVRGVDYWTEADKQEIKLEAVDLIPSSVKIETGSYVGTGTSGAGSPNTLTFAITPKMVIIYRDIYSPVTYGTYQWGSSYQVFLKGASSISVAASNNDGYSGYTYFTFDGTSFSWYNNGIYYTAQMQMNVENVTYHYIAIG